MTVSAEEKFNDFRRLSMVRVYESEFALFSWLAKGASAHSPLNLAEHAGHMLCVTCAPVWLSRYRSTVLQ